MQSNSDWNETAADLARKMRNQHFQAHRGATPTPGHLDVVALFGNDGYRDNPKTQRLIEALRQDLAGSGLREIGFGLSREGNTWVLLIAGDPLAPEQTFVERVRVCDAMLWAAWWRTIEEPPDATYENVQRAIAVEETAKLMSRWG